MMRKYEQLLLTVPEITQDELQNLEKQLSALIQEAKGTIVSFEKWGKFKLAYPVRNNDYGVYILVRFDAPVPSTLIPDLHNYFIIKLGDVVMRAISTALDPKKPLTYQRPRSLEEAPTSRDVGMFFKENKMDGFFAGEGKNDEMPADLRRSE